MPITKIGLFFVSFEIKNQFFFVSLAPFLLFRGLNLSVVNNQDPGKTRKNKTHFMLWTSHYEHYTCIMDIMTA